jgi:hypothetical protein
MDATPAPQVSRLTPLGLSRLSAKFLQDRFRIKLNARSSIGVATTPQVQPLLLPVPKASELDRIAAILVDAFLNRGQSYIRISTRHLKYHILK